MWCLQQLSWVSHAFWLLVKWSVMFTTIELSITCRWIASKMKCDVYNNWQKVTIDYVPDATIFMWAFFAKSLQKKQKQKQKQKKNSKKKKKKSPFSHFFFFACWNVNTLEYVGIKLPLRSTKKCSHSGSLKLIPLLLVLPTNPHNLNFTILLYWLLLCVTVKTRFI